MGCGSSSTKGAASPEQKAPPGPTPGASNAAPSQSQPAKSSERADEFDDQDEFSQYPGDKYADERESFEKRVDQAHHLAQEIHTQASSILTNDHICETSLCETSRRGAMEGDFVHGKLDMHCVEEFSKALFMECDLDHGNDISQAELAPLVQLMFDKRPDIAAVYSFNITKATADILVTIDDDSSRSLDYTEFVHLLSTQPWTALVPKELFALSQRLLEERDTTGQSA